MPAFAKSRVGSAAGTSDELGTTRCPRSWKNLRNALRISSAVFTFFVASPVSGRQTAPSFRVAVAFWRRVERCNLVFFKHIAGSRPKHGEPFADQLRREAAPQQGREDPRQALARLEVLALAQQARGDRVERGLLGPLAEGVRKPFLGRLARHAALPQRRTDTIPPEAVVGEPAAGKGLGEPAVVERARLAEAREGIGDRFLGMASALQRPSQLGDRVVAPGETAERGLVRGRLRLLPDPALLHLERFHGLRHFLGGHVGGGLDALDLELELVRVAGASQRLLVRDQLLLVEVEDGLVEGLHAVLRHAGGDRLVDQAGLVLVDDAVADERR